MPSLITEPLPPYFQYYYRKPNEFYQIPNLRPRRPANRMPFRMLLQRPNHAAPAGPEGINTHRATAIDKAATQHALQSLNFRHSHT